MIGCTVLSHENFITFQTQVKVSLITRPLCAMSSDPNILQPLIPLHFLIGASLFAIPERDIPDISMFKLGHWEIQQMLQHLRKRQNYECSSTHHQKYKCFHCILNFKISDVVITKNEHLSSFLLKIVEF